MMFYALATLCFSLMLVWPTIATATSSSIVFYYAQIEQPERLSLYDRAVLQPNLVTNDQVRWLIDSGTEVYAYISVSELEQELMTPALEPAILGDNDQWQSNIMDLADPRWIEFLLEQANSFKTRGFQGLFLDTIDGFHNVVLTTDQLQHQQTKTEQIIRQLGEVFAGNLILNRGFSYLEQVQDRVAAVAAESYQLGFSPEKGYYNVKPDHTQWLEQQLQAARAFGLETIVIDYSTDHELRLDAARRLLNLGHTPYLADGYLVELGVSHHYTVPNQIVALYDGSQTTIMDSRVFNVLSLPFERAGYLIRFHDIASQPLPQLDQTKHAALIVWMPASKHVLEESFAEWVMQRPASTKLLWIETPLSPVLAEHLKLEALAIHSQLDYDTYAQSVMDRLGIAGFETPLAPLGLEADKVFAHQGKGTAVIDIEYEQISGSLLVSMPWGVAAASNGLIYSDPFEQVKWVIDPKTLIYQLMGLLPIPIADVTTENGRRIVTAHIDGDGFPSKSTFPGNPYSAQVILDEVVSNYPHIPTTVSVIESEIAPHGLHGSISTSLEAIAKAFFVLPQVEIASHTYSHPFVWNHLTKGILPTQIRHLPVEGYALDLQREVNGSIDYINDRLAPADKSVKLFLWSGFAEPDASTVALTAQAGVLNLNGGRTYVRGKQTQLNRISPTIVPYVPAPQVLAPVTNENIYTHLWTRNFGGYEKVIETFQALDRTERFKPISIYYHMYSGEYPNALAAVKKVYEWALAQQGIPMRLSDYAQRASGLMGFTIGKRLAPDSEQENRHWEVRSNGIRTVRMPLVARQQAPLDQSPSVKTSEQVLGWREIHGDLYIHLSANRGLIDWSVADAGRPANMPFIHSSNAEIYEWLDVSSLESTPEGAEDFYQWQFSLSAHAPAVLEIAHGTQCEIELKLPERLAGKTVMPSAEGSGRASFGTMEPSITLPQDSSETKSIDAVVFELNTVRERTTGVLRCEA